MNERTNGSLVRVAVLLAALAVCLAGGPLIAAENSPQARDLVGFSRAEKGADTVCTLDLGNSEVKTLYSSKTEKLSAPVVCANRGFAIFASNDNKLHRVGLDGTEHRILATFPKGDRWLAFDVSKDGQQAVIALCASNDQKADGLYLVDTQSGKATSLISEDCYAPRFSPDGKRIAFESSRDGHYQIFVMDLAGKSRIKLSDKDEDTAYRACWSSDGKRVAFHDCNSGLLVADAATGKCKRVAQMGKDAFCCAFSPDGRWVAFRSADAICTVAADGGEPIVQTKTSLGVSVIEWSSDGKTVVFDQQADTPDGSELKSFNVVDVETKKTRLLKEW